MTIPRLSLEGVSHALPDGRPLFSSLSIHFDSQPTGLVGRNGVGKSVLARILAGELMPAAGHCLRSGRVYHLPQCMHGSAGQTVAALAGVAAELDALARIEAGSVDSADFEVVAERWDLRVRLAAELEKQGLYGLAADDLTITLSGGEAMRVALAGAWLSQADFLILDEPSNHLDGDQRQRLYEQLECWPRGLLAISHDRALLERMKRIVEMSPQGLRSYGGGYGFYAQCREREQDSAAALLAQRQTERRRGEQALRRQHERQQQRQARGERDAHDANQARILLGGRKQRAQASAGRLQLQRAETRARLQQRVQEAAAQIGREAEIALLPPLPPPARRRIATLQHVVMPFGIHDGRCLDLEIGGAARIAVVGPNGSGKSTLLRLLAGQLAPAGGRCEVHAPVAYVDQHQRGLEPRRSVLSQLQDAHPAADQGFLRTRLALLGLDQARAQQASGLLSGGERLKGALACAVYARTPAQLLLLDEPSNALDLPSLAALERVLRAYTGALLVVSHDQRLLERLGLQQRLDTGAGQWRLAPW